jgi:hypothetical protein
LEVTVPEVTILEVTILEIIIPEVTWHRFEVMAFEKGTL